MKIKSIRVIGLGYEKKHPPMPRSFALVRVETDAGHIGYGEASTSYGHNYPFLIKTIVEDLLARVLVGKNPLDIKERVREIRLYLDPWIGWEGVSSTVVAAIEIALWDILGKEAGLPVSHLLGSSRERIPLYGTGTLYFGDDKNFHGQFFDSVLRQGFKGVKTRIGNNPKIDILQIDSVRKHIGTDIKLMVDAFWSYSLQSAIKLAKQMEEFDVYFFEEPLPQYRIKALSRLRSESPVPIALGERIFTLSGFSQVIDYQAADFLQPDATICGGIAECIDVAALGKANDLLVIPHIGGLSAVGIAANLHLAAVIGSPMLEFDSDPYQPMRDEILLDPVFAVERIVNGCLLVPQAPGLGIEIDESKFESFAYKPGKVYPDFFPQFGQGIL